MSLEGWEWQSGNRPQTLARFNYFHVSESLQLIRIASVQLIVYCLTFVLGIVSGAILVNQKAWDQQCRESLPCEFT